MQRHAALLWALGLTIFLGGCEGASPKLGQTNEGLTVDTTHPFDERFTTSPLNQTNWTWSCSDVQAGTTASPTPVIESGALHVISASCNAHLSLNASLSGPMLFAVSYLLPTTSHHLGLKAMGYLVDLSYQTGVMTLKRVDGYVETTLQSTTNWAALLASSFHYRIRLDVIPASGQKTRLLLWVDDRVVMQATDNAPVPGTGFEVTGGYGTDILVDDIAIHTIGANSGSFDDHFNRPTGVLGSPWSGSAGTFTVQDDTVNGVASRELHMVSDMSNPVLTVPTTVVGGASHSVRFRNADLCDRIGIVVRDTYQLMVLRQWSRLVLWRKSADGSVTELGRAENWSSRVANSSDFRMRLDLDGSTIRAYLDDQLLIETDDTVTMNTTGNFSIVGGWGTNVYVDDVLIRPMHTYPDSAYDETFDSLADNATPSSADWTLSSGTFVGSGKTLKVTSGNGNPVVTSTRTWTGDTSYSVTLLDAPGCHWSGIYVHDLYYMTVNRQYDRLTVWRTDTGAEIGHVDGWEAYAIDPTGYKIQLRLDVVGNVVRGFLDGRLLIEATDITGPTTGGHLALVGGWGTNVRFDNVHVESLAQRDWPTYVDTFDQSLVLAWQGSGGAFTVSGGQLHLQSVQPSGQSNLVLHLDRAYTGDLHMSARLIGVKSHADWAGVVLQGTYWITFVHQYNEFSVEKQLADGSRVRLGTVGNWLSWAPRYPDYVNTDDFTIDVTQDGPKLHVSINGSQKVLDVVDNLGGAPSVGSVDFVGGWGTDIQLDDVTVGATARGAAGRPTVELVSARFPYAQNPMSVAVPFPKRCITEPPPGTPAACGRNVTPAIFLPGSTVGAEVKIKLPTWTTATTRTLRFELVDQEGYRSNSLDRTMSVSPGNTETFNVSFAAPRRGVFKVRVTELWRPSKPFLDVATFGVLPTTANSLGTDTDATYSPFGGHPWWETWFSLGYDETQTPPVVLDPGPDLWHWHVARQLGTRWARLHDMAQYTWWQTIEPTRGNYLWNQLDTNGVAAAWNDAVAHLDAMAAQNLRILGTVSMPPSWVVTSGQVQTIDLSAYSSYVSGVVSRLKSRIKHWEVWNEPDGEYLPGSTNKTQAYVQLACTAFHAIHDADKGNCSDCKVVVGAVTSNCPRDRACIDGWFSTAVNVTGTVEHLNDCMDVFSFHYGESSSADAADQQRFASDLQYIKPGKTIKPLWNSEASATSASFLAPYGYPGLNSAVQPLEAAGSLLRLYANQLALGVERIFLYYSTSENRDAGAMARAPIGTTLLDVASAPKPDAIAYAMAAELLSGKIFGATVDRNGGPSGVLPGVLQAHIFRDNSTGGATSGDIVVVVETRLGRDPRVLELQLGATAFAKDLVDVMGNHTALGTGATTVGFGRVPSYIFIAGSTGASVAQVQSWLASASCPACATIP